MDNVNVRKLATVKVRKFLIRWFSSTILRHSPRNIILKFRQIEKLLNKIVHLKGHLSFNETCFNNALLPVYTNIYIYISLIEK